MTPLEPKDIKVGMKVRWSAWDQSKTFGNDYVVVSTKPTNKGFRGFTKFKGQKIVETDWYFPHSGFWYKYPSSIKSIQDVCNFLKLIK